MNYKKQIVAALKKLKLFAKTNFVILFGSVSQKQETPLSDIDICISLNLAPQERFNAKIKLLSILPEQYDIQIFEDLPLYVQKNVISGKLIYCKDKKKLVEQAMSIIREYDDFKKVYEYYLAKDKSTVEI